MTTRAPAVLKSGWMRHHLEIYIGRPIVTDVSCSHLKFIFYEFIHFALPKCRLNLDQHEYKLLQLSSSASQYDTWVNMHSILLICISVIHEIQKYIGIFEKICTVWKPKVLLGETAVDFSHLIVRDCCWGKRDQECPPKTKIFIMMEWWWSYFFNSQITKNPILKGVVSFGLKEKAVI